MAAIVAIRRGPDRERSAAGRAPQPGDRPPDPRGRRHWTADHAAAAGVLAATGSVPARAYRTTPMPEIAAHSSSPLVTSTSPTWRRALIVNAATIPRAPVIAFQPAIAAARDEQRGVVADDRRDPDVDRRAARARRRRPRPTARRHPARRRSAISAPRPSMLPRRIATSGPRRSATAPQTRNDDGRRAGGQDPDDADVGEATGRAGRR